MIIARNIVHAIAKSTFGVALLFLGLQSSISTGLAEESSMKTQPIMEIEVNGLRSITEDEMLYLLDLKKGIPLDAKQLRIGIKRAFLKGIFQDIVVESLDAQRDRIRVIVKEKNIIKSIDIAGASHFSNSFIKKSLSIKKGDRLNYGKLENSVATLRDVLKIKGFPDSNVSYSVSEPRNNKVNVNITIAEGEPLLIKERRISGGSSDDGKDISRRLKLSPGDIMDRDSIDQSLEKIKADYKNKYYMNTQISYSFTNGILDIDFTPGQTLTIVFDGNGTVSSSSLKKEIPFYELDEFSDDILEETVTRIISLYHREGFPDAQIAPVVTAAERDINIKFFIHEGDRYRVEKITFPESSINSDKLKSIIQLQTGELYNPDLVTPDNDSIRDFYHSLGYLYVNVEEPAVEINDKKASIAFMLNEGIQVRATAVEIKNNKNISSEEILLNIPLKKGNPYNEVDILDSRIKIQNIYRNKGYLDASVATEREIAGETASITFIVQEGKEYFFGKSVVTGNEDTKRKVITRALLHKEADPFNYSLLLGERQRLYRTGLFKDVETAPWEEKLDNIKDVLYRIEEGDAGAIEFGLGYGEYEKFRGFMDISYKNLFGMNRQLSFRTEMSTLNRRFIIQYFEPWFLERELAFKAQILREYKKELNIDTRQIDYRLSRYTATAGVEKKLSSNVKGEVYYELDNVKTYDVKPDIVLTHEDTGTLLISGFKAGLIYDSRDNPVNSRSGILGGITYKVATALLFSETDFNKIQMYANKYLALSKNIVLAVSIRAGAAKGFSRTTELPLVERFFLGGRTTVRGYAQDTLGPRGVDNNPTGGDAFLMGNVEFRFDVWKGLGFVTFLDWGNVWQKAEQVTFNDIKYTTGVGLRYNTPVGPLSIDYGYKLNRRTGESKGEIHFSVGQSF